MKTEESPPIDLTRIAPPADAIEMAESGHLVQFYEDDAFLMEAVSRFIGVGLEAGGEGVVIATKPHLDRIEERLSARGLDITLAREEGRYIALDAASTLSEIMNDGWPDDRRFAEVVGKVIERAAQEPGARVQVFGEMVALLWAEGNQKAAMRLEELWSLLIRRRSFSLLCAYPMHSFGTADHGNAFLAICAEHSQVIPTERYAALPTPDERLRMIASLQQKAAALEAELAERREIEKALEAANRGKDEFLAVLSHELRTPLNAILGWARILKAGSPDAAMAARAVEVIERNAKLQAQLISDLLDVSRIISGKLQLDLQQVDLVPIVRAAIDDLRLSADAKKIQLNTSLDIGTGPVLGEPNRLQQVVSNLLSNAIKFTPDHGQIEVRLERTETEAIIIVRDTGQGISPEFLPHIFERFRQFDSTTSRGHRGLGLGLAVARHLVELHGGAIHAESAGVGQGATFTVRLQLDSLDSQELPSLSVSASGALKSLNGVRIFVVDDEADARELVATVLEQHEARVKTASDVDDLLEMMELERPDVLVADIGMPGKDGYALIRALRARPETARIPVIALTAYASAADVQHVLSAGFHSHIAKPLEPARLVEVIAMLVETTHPRTA